MEDLQQTCRTLVRNQTAMALLRHPPAQLFVGEPANECCWIVSELLWYWPHTTLQTAVTRVSSFCRFHLSRVISLNEAVLAFSTNACPSTWQLIYERAADGLCFYSISFKISLRQTRAGDRLPRVDYLPGDGGALVESLVYGVSAPLPHVPMYGSRQNPAGTGAAAALRSLTYSPLVACRGKTLPN